MPPTSHLSVPASDALPGVDPDGVLVQSASKVPGFRIPRPTAADLAAMTAQQRARFRVLASRQQAG